MPRPMGGSGGNNRSSSGHSYSTRSSSGHRMNANSSPTPRPGSAQNRSSGSFNQPGSSFNQRRQTPYYNPNTYGNSRRSSLFPFLMGGMLGGMNSRRRSSINPYDPRMNAGNPNNPNNPNYGYGQPRRSGGSAFGLMAVVFIVLICVFMFSCMGCSSSKDNSAIPASGYNREKIQSDVAFNSNCIVDEEGFFDNPSKTGSQLKSFYDKTGVQPYIVIESYDPSLKTDAQKAAYAKEYYDRNIKNEDTFLYMYFADADPNAVGYMQTVNGKKVDTVMDSQAVDIFWNYLDNEWTSGKSTDQMFVDVFNQTANRIMTKTATSNDVAMRSLLVVVVIAVIAGVILLIYMKNKRAREKAEETARILATPLKTDDPDDDDLVNRYSNK